jgi:3,4-dihydroxyphenylacetate 2,3-dioxygenase
MAGALGGAACTAPGELFSEYEASVGTGQVHVWFERPATGWTGSTEAA